MGKVTGFKEFERQDETYTPVENRVKHYKEFTSLIKRARTKKTRFTMYGLWYSILS